ncbi:MAG: AzlC family ABC transporter permease [Microbacteriaceae bacterium]|nr:AzlC family ABC transporter permease [Microbacteriaceae bacterium]
MGPYKDSKARDPEIATAIRSGVAVGVAVSLYGVSFGALAVAAGLDVWQTCALSLLMFTGGSQFALIGVLAAGAVPLTAATGWAAVAAATLLGTRNALYALRAAPIVGPGRLRRLAAAHWTIDETIAVSTAQGTPAARRAGFWITGVVIYAGWNVTTLIGALIGDLLGDVRAWGLDAAAAAAFLGLLWPRLRGLQPVAVAIAAAVVAVACVPWTPPGVPVLAATAVAIVAGLTNALGPRGGASAPETPQGGLPA